MLWNYNAKVLRVVDGDTYDVEVDLGFYVYHHIRVRLRGVNTPEIFGRNASEEGKKVAEYVKSYIEGKTVLIGTYKTKPTTFGRWEADVIVEGVSVADHLVALGYATRVDVP
jgi:micrococcal nuclease